GDGAQITILETELVDEIAFGAVDFFNARRHFEAEDLGRLVQTLTMLVAFEHDAAISALAFEHRRGIVERMRQHMNLGLAMRDEFAVHPDPAVAIVERLSSHGFPPMMGRALRSRRADGMVFERNL